MSKEEENSYVNQGSMQSLEFLFSFISDFFTAFSGVNRVCLAMSLIVCYMTMTCMYPE